jgi:hypothetical protein
MSVRDLAAANFTRHLKQNAYPGRGLVVGRSSVETAWLMVYWIMGRSAHSRNRRFFADGRNHRPEPVEQHTVHDTNRIKN